MNIGFVTTWFERGAAYVTKGYMDLLQEGNNLFVYARGGESYAKGNPKWNKPNVTWGYRLTSTEIDWKHFSKWIKDNKIDVILFNEQHDLMPVLLTKKYFNHIRLGSYVDYYTERTVSDFSFYDFLICNTKRHYSVFANHPGAYYVPWGTDIKLFSPKERSDNHDEVVFFHSMGMSYRKGTNLLIDAFVKGKFAEKGAKLIIHSQIEMGDITGHINLSRNGIEVIKKEVTAPGLYFLGDVYVYPTTLEGLGLTIYEALASGMPVITTDEQPMNEVVNEKNGKLVSVEKSRSRSDGYFWPLSDVNIDSLIKQMMYYIENRDNLSVYKKASRKYAEQFLDWSSQKDVVRKIFEDTDIISPKTITEVNEKINKIKKDRNKLFLRDAVSKFVPSYIRHYLKSSR